MKRPICLLIISLIRQLRNKVEYVSQNVFVFLYRQVNIKTNSVLFYVETVANNFFQLNVKITEKKSMLEKLETTPLWSVA